MITTVEPPRTPLAAKFLNEAPYCRWVTVKGKRIWRISVYFESNCNVAVTWVRWPQLTVIDNDAQHSFDCRPYNQQNMKHQYAAHLSVTEDYVTDLFRIVISNMSGGIDTQFVNPFKTLGPILSNVRKEVNEDREETHFTAIIHSSTPFTVKWKRDGVDFDMASDERYKFDVIMREQYKYTISLIIRYMNRAQDAGVFIMELTNKYCTIHTHLPDPLLYSLEGRVMEYRRPTYGEFGQPWMYNFWIHSNFPIQAFGKRNGVKLHPDSARLLITPISNNGNYRVDLETYEATDGYFEISIWNGRDTLTTSVQCLPISRRPPMGSDLVYGSYVGNDYVICASFYHDGPVRLNWLRQIGDELVEVKYPKYVSANEKRVDQNFMDYYQARLTIKFPRFEDSGLHFLRVKNESGEADIALPVSLEPVPPVERVLPREGVDGSELEDMDKDKNEGEEEKEDEESDEGANPEEEMAPTSSTSQTCTKQPNSAENSEKPNSKENSEKPNSEPNSEENSENIPLHSDDVTIAEAPPMDSAMDVSEVVEDIIEKVTTVENENAKVENENAPRTSDGQHQVDEEIIFLFSVPPKMKKLSDENPEIIGREKEDGQGEQTDGIDVVNEDPMKERDENAAKENETAKEVTTRSEVSPLVSKLPNPDESSGKSPRQTADENNDQILTDYRIVKTIKLIQYEVPMEENDEIAAEEKEATKLSTTTSTANPLLPPNENSANTPSQTKDTLAKESTVDATAMTEKIEDAGENQKEQVEQNRKEIISSTTKKQSSPDKNPTKRQLHEEEEVQVAKKPTKYTIAADASNIIRKIVEDHVPKEQNDPKENQNPKQRTMAPSTSSTVKKRPHPEKSRKDLDVLKNS